MMATVLVFVTLVLASYNTAFGQEVSAEQKIRDFLSKVFGITVTTVSEDPCVLYEYVGLPYKNFTVDGCCEVAASADGSIIYEYESENLFFDEQEITKGKTLEDAISDDEAFPVAVPILEFYELPTVKSEYQMELIDPVSEIRGDLFGSSWFIKKEMKLDEIPCRRRAIYIFVSAASKRLFDFGYYPVISPENTLDDAIPYASARQTALDWLEEQSYLGEDISLTLTGDANNGVQVIAPNLNQLKSMFGETEPTKTYYCWEVPFTWVPSESILNGVVWVNLQTGEIVGTDQVDG